MKSAKDMLDSLMGPSRNMAAKDRKGDDFKMDNVCTHFFVGLCPGQLLCKHVDAVERCKLLHSVALKEELEKHPDCEKYKREYEDKYTRRLEEICSDADAKVAKEKRKCRPPETVIKLPDHLKIKVQCYEEARAERLKEANDRGEAGDLEGSQMAMRSSQQAQRDIDGINKAHTSTFPGEDVCKLCGIKYLLGGAGVTGYERLKDGELWEEDHYKSKGHEAYKQVRDALTEMRKKRREREQEDDTARKPGKERSRSRDRGGGREGKERERDTRDRGDRRDTDRRDGGGRDQGGDRRGDRDGERGGDRDRDRGGNGRDGGGRDGGDRRDNNRDRGRDNRDRDRRRSRSR
mmetsp:Transcript_82893/g.210959  ORF Transcript_82893/g.210959 Transcript_82893/m.210959 type:complete len:348 (-) Transcript_82893:76-1119(-)